MLIEPFDQAGDIGIFYGDAVCNLSGHPDIFLKHVDKDFVIVSAASDLTRIHTKGGFARELFLSEYVLTS